MGEIAVKPIHNVHKVYRKMNLVNPYLFAGDFTSTWNTNNTSTGSSTTTQVKLPLISAGTYDFIVDWGDGSSNTITVWNQAQTTHTYASAGTYTIKIKGTCIGWQFNNSGDRLKILTITKWGKLRLGTNQGSYFYGCANLNLSGITDVLDLTGTISLASCFQGCSSLTTIGRLNEFNMLSVTSIAGMFYNATNFNQNISNWNTANIINMSGVFGGDGAGTSLFNQDLGNWNVSSVVDFTSMFGTDSVRITSFNNGGNDNIKNWQLKNTGTITFENMFGNARFFNQNISNWNTSRVINMRNMFSTAIAFNQNIGNWNVSNVTNMGQFMIGKTPVNFSTTNLDAIYNGWSNRLAIASLITTFGTAKYTAGAIEGKALFTRTNSTKSITNVVNNGSGLIRISATAHGLSTGNKCFISGVVGTTEANGAWIVTVIDANTIDLNGSTFTNTYLSAGILRTGYGWTITDGGI